MAQEQTLESYTPLGFISGRIIAVKGHEKESVFNTARSLLDSDHLRFSMTVDKGHAWYLAAPSNVFGDYPEASSPLSAALPGAPGHRGDGAYVVEINPVVSAVVIKNTDSLKSYVGSQALVARFIENEGNLTRFDVSTSSMKWEGFLDQERREGLVFARKTLLAGLAIAALLIGSLFGATSINASSKSVVAKQLKKYRDASMTVARQISNDSDAMLDVLIEHQSLLNTVSSIQAAHIRYFRYENGKSTWAVELPEAAPKEQISRLGGSQQGVESSVESGKIIVKKS